MDRRANQPAFGLNSAASGTCFRDLAEMVSCCRISFFFNKVRAVPLWLPEKIASPLRACVRMDLTGFLVVANLAGCACAVTVRAANACVLSIAPLQTEVDASVCKRTRARDPGAAKPRELRKGCSPGGTWHKTPSAVIKTGHGGGCSAYVDIYLHRLQYRILTERLRFPSSSASTEATVTS